MAEESRKEDHAWFQSQLEEAKKKADGLAEEAKAAALAHAADLKEEAAALKEEAARGAASMKEEAARAAAEVREAATAATEEAARAAAEIQQAAHHHANEIKRDDGTKVLSIADGPLGFHLEGAQIISVEPESQAACLGIEPGDVIVSVAGEVLPCMSTDCEPVEANKRHRALIQRRIKAATRPVLLGITKAEKNAPSVKSPEGASSSLIQLEASPAEGTSQQAESTTKEPLHVVRSCADNALSHDLQEQKDSNESGGQEDLAIDTSIDDSGWDFDDEVQVDLQVGVAAEVEKESDTEKKKGGTRAQVSEANAEIEKARESETQKETEKANVEHEPEHKDTNQEESSGVTVDPQPAELKVDDLKPVESKVKVWSAKEWKAKLDSVLSELHEAQKQVAEEQEKQEDMVYELQAAERELKGVQSEKMALHGSLKQEEAICAEVQILQKQVKTQATEIKSAQQSGAAASQAAQLELQEMQIQRSSLQVKLEHEEQKANKTMTALKAESTEASEELMSETKARQAALGSRLEEEDAARSAAMALKVGLQEQLAVTKSELWRSQDQGSSFRKEIAQVRQELQDANASFSHRDQRVNSAHALLENHAQTLREQLIQAQNEHTAYVRDGDEALHNAMQEADERFLLYRGEFSSELKAVREEQRVAEVGEQKTASELARIRNELMAAEARHAEVNQKAHCSLVDLQEAAEAQQKSLQDQLETQAAARDAAEQLKVAAEEVLEEQKVACATAQESESSHKQLIRALQQELLETQESLRSEGQELLEIQKQLQHTEEAAISDKASELSTSIDVAEQKPQDQTVERKTRIAPAKLEPDESDIPDGQQGAGEDSPYVVVEKPLASAQLREELALLSERNRVLQRRLDAQPIMFKPPPEEKPSSASAEDLQNMPPWKRMAYVILDLFLGIVEPPLKHLTEALVRRRTALVAFWLHIFIMYTILGSHFFTQSPDAADPSQVAEEFMKQKGAPPNSNGPS